VGDRDLLPFSSSSLYLRFLIELDLSFLRAFTYIILNLRLSFYYITTTSYKDARNTYIAS
jgi:hypothetical protein